MHWPDTGFGGAAITLRFLAAWAKVVMEPITNHEFETLVRDVGNGSEHAAWELVERYGEAIRRAVRRALDRRLRSKYDSLDFVQLVWSSFFRSRGRTAQFAQPAQLVAFLVKMAQNKVGMEVRRRLKTEKSDVKRESSLDVICSRQDLEPASAEAAPFAVAIARERWNKLLDGQPEHYRQIIAMKLHGHTCQDIADQLGLSERTVRRLLKRLLNETLTYLD